MIFFRPGQPLQVDVSPIPGIPDRNGTPVSRPGHLERDQTVLLIESHAVSIHGYLLSVIASPVSETLASVCTMDHNYVHGFRATELTYRHLVYSFAFCIDFGYGTI
jgi:hypothetical protein